MRGVVQPYSSLTGVSEELQAEEHFWRVLCHHSKNNIGPHLASEVYISPG